MEKHSFLTWLEREVSSARFALLALYEKRDKLRFIDGPMLERDYMDKVGNFEESIIQEEIEVELLEKKQQMIQAAINRREPIDEAAIDAEIEKLRQQKLTEAANYGGGENSDVMELTGEQTNELQDLYHTIVKCYHPQMHPELTEIHKKLFMKAQDAYRRKDLEALRLIHDMLLQADGDVDLDELLDMLIDSVAQGETEPVRREYTTDYALASILYPYFRHTAEEASLQEEWDRYKVESDGMMAVIESIQKEFPFSAAQMLSDPEQLEAYKKDLEYRLYEAQKEREWLSQQIRSMIERVAVHG